MTILKSFGNPTLQKSLNADELYLAQNTKPIPYTILPAEPGTYVICKYSDSNAVYLEKVLLWEVSYLYDDYCIMPIGLTGRIDESENIDGFMYFLFPDGLVRSTGGDFRSLEYFLNKNNLVLNEMDIGIAASLGGL